MAENDDRLSRIHQPVSSSTAESLLFDGSKSVVLLVALTATFLVGLRFYVDTMSPVSTFSWPLYTDSPTAIALTVMSVMTVLPFASESIDAVQNTRVTAFIHTFAFTWLVKYGLWVTVALNIHPTKYLSSGASGWFSYPMVIFSHLLFVAFAFVIVEYGKTTSEAVLTAGVVLLVNDVYDYVLGFHPPLRYEPELLLPMLTVGLSMFVVWLAWWQFDELHT